MTIYAIHCYSADSAEMGPMEAFPSVERASVALQLRARKQESATYYVDEDPDARPRPVCKFPLADDSGTLIVWRRTARQPRPTLDDPPEELWRLSPGGAVIKEPHPEGRPGAEGGVAVPPRTVEEAVERLADESVTLYRLRDRLINRPEERDALVQTLACVSGLRIALCLLKGWDPREESDKEGRADEFIVARWREQHPEDWAEEGRAHP